MTTNSYCTQFLRSIGDNQSWKPLEKLMTGSCRTTTFVAPAGDGATGALFLSAVKDFSDPSLAQDSDMVKNRALATKYGIAESLLDLSPISSGWLHGEMLRELLLRADARPGGLTRPNVLLAARETNLTSGLLHTGVQLKLAGKDDAYLVESARFDHWNGTTFEKAGEIDHDATKASCGSKSRDDGRKPPRFGHGSLLACLRAQTASTAKAPCGCRGRLGDRRSRR